MYAHAWPWRLAVMHLTHLWPPCACSAAAQVDGSQAPVRNFVNSLLAAKPPTNTLSLAYSRELLAAPEPRAASSPQL